MSMIYLVMIAVVHINRGAFWLISMESMDAKPALGEVQVICQGYADSSGITLVSHQGLVRWNSC